MKYSMNENKRMTSIARKINISFWMQELGNVIFIDIIIAFLVMGTYMYWGYQNLPDGVDGEHFYFGYNEEQKTCEYLVDASDGKTYTYDLMDLWDFLQVPVIILLSSEGVILFFALFRTSVVRRRLKPLNDLAVKAEKISQMASPFEENKAEKNGRKVSSFEENKAEKNSRKVSSFEENKAEKNGQKISSYDRKKMENLEQAISHISPDDAEQGIHTGDKDLQSIEIALNNLLKSMKENEKRQMRFVSDASHELRTPIAVIQGYVNMLDRWGKADEQVLTESIEALKNESQHMKDLVEQLLFLARGDSGRNTLNKVKLDLNQMVSEVWEESMMIDETHKYVFRGTTPAYMIGDVAMIKQSVRIFVQNAAKYSKEGAEIILAVKQEPGFVSYLIQDEGIGMESSDVVHIFERFYRSDEARNGETGGSGLGLSIAKWIVDAHSGTIQVVSRPDVGTRFIVRFPEV